MQTNRTRTLMKYVIPAILSNACIFLFTIIDGIFVGNGISSDALGAVNIAMPMVMIATAINMLTSIGGCAITAIRLGQYDKNGANEAFLHSLTANAVFAGIITFACMALTEPLSIFLARMNTICPWSKSMYSGGAYLLFPLHFPSTSSFSAATMVPPCWSWWQPLPALC